MITVKKMVLAIPALLLLGCSSTTDTQLTSRGAQVKVYEGSPMNECRFIGKVEGSKSNWVSGMDESKSIWAAKAILQNKAADLGANALFNVAQEGGDFVSQFYPSATKMVADAYECD